MDADDLRKELGKAQLLIGRTANATGGNRTKRIQIFQRAMSHDDWLKVIYGDCEGWDLRETIQDEELDTEGFNEAVSELLTLVPSKDPPAGVNQPKKWVGTSNVFARSPAVKAWILQQAAGKCENCGESTFLDDEGRWYLEVHHLLSLARGGSDTLKNTVALCSNCHRAFHYSANRELLKVNLIAHISRLSDES